MIKLLYSHTGRKVIHFQFSTYVTYTKEEVFCIGTPLDHFGKFHRKQTHVRLRIINIGRSYFTKKHLIYHCSFHYVL